MILMHGATPKDSKTSRFALFFIFLAFTRIFQSSKGKEQQLLQKGPWEVLFLAIGSLAGPKQGKGTAGARRPVSGGAGRRR